jgi:hypothetical protein
MKRILMLSVVCFSFTSNAMLADPAAQAEGVRRQQMDVILQHFDENPPRFDHIPGVTNEALQMTNQQVASRYKGLSDKEKGHFAFLLTSERPNSFFGKLFYRTSAVFRVCTYGFWKSISVTSRPLKHFFILAGPLIPIALKCISILSHKEILSDSEQMAITELCSVGTAFFTHVGEFATTSVEYYERDEMLMRAMDAEWQRALRVAAVRRLEEERRVAGDQHEAGVVDIVDPIEEALLDDGDPRHMV